jgi:hypothetical protein
MARHGKSYRGCILLSYGDRYVRKMLELLTTGERGGNMPQDRPTPPARRGSSAPSARNRSQQASNRGAYSAYGAFSAHFIWCGSAVYPPVGPSPGTLSRLSRLSRLFRIFRIFLQASLEASGASGWWSGILIPHTFGPFS